MHTKEYRDKRQAEVDQFGDGYTIPPWKPWRYIVDWESLDCDSALWTLAQHITDGSSYRLNREGLDAMQVLANAHGCKFVIDEEAVEAMRREVEQ